MKHMLLLDTKDLKSKLIDGVNAQIKDLEGVTEDDKELKVKLQNLIRWAEKVKEKQTDEDYKRLLLSIPPEFR